jgi:hypothetical protein
VVSHDDRDVDELPTTHGSDIWEVIMCCVDVGRVAIVVGVPRERSWCFGRVVDARFRRQRGMRLLGKDTRRDKKKHESDPVQKHDGGYSRQGAEQELA